MKFRCFQCNQVLKTGRSKVGSVVACPKCGAELLVPEPPPEQPEPVRTEPDIPAIGSTPEQGEPGWTMPAIQLRARPEEPRSAPKARAFPVEVEPAGGSSLEAFGFYAQPDEGSPAPTPPPAPPPLQPPAEPSHPQPPFVSSSSDTEFPDLHIEPPPIGPARVPGSVADYVAPRARDVLIPRAALVGWSLFALFALLLSFVAGLLAGHFVWVVKVISR